MSNLLTFDPAIQKRVQAWLLGNYDASTKEAIQDMLERHPQELIDSFYTDLSFGTGGLRALMGVGTNRLNIYTIRLATQGLANYILKSPHNVQNLAVAIGYDSRHHSKEFAEETARVFAGNGITAHLFPDLRPTPYTSFACRELRCQAAVMITASHNPKEYNGYKVYWSDGGQVVPPHDTGIIAEIEKISSQDHIHLAPLHSSLIFYTDSTLDETYLKALFALQLAKDRNQEHGKQLRIAYTSLHGTGITLAPRALASWGFSTIEYVKEQIEPNGDFPSVQFPNPEYPETLKLGIELLSRKQCDLLLANDPDADRLGVVVLHQGTPVILTGNEVASICVDYLCTTLKEQNRLTSHHAFITTIVSTELIGKISKAAGSAYFEVLTGFKYIGEKIHEWEVNKESYQFLFGAEESYGYLLGTVARDKDAIISSCLLAEIALASKLNGQTLVDRLYAIYKTYGVHREGQLSLNFKPGKTGTEEITRWMTHLRNHPPRHLCGKTVLLVEDYLTSQQHNLATGTLSPLSLPTSDVLLFRFEGGSRLVVRPSGTEPKVKLYGSVCLPPNIKSLNEAIHSCDALLKEFLSSAKRDLQP
ncbi:MAG: phospho-sugar mutase [Simkania sp.]|nr:phospho-sugar mutase [Simkania sp.]